MFVTHPPRPRTRWLRLALTQLLAISSTVLSRPAAAQGCVDYGSYLHWTALEPWTAISALEAADGWLYAASGLQLRAYRLDDPAAPELRSEVPIAGAAMGITACSDLVLVAQYSQGVKLFEIQLDHSLAPVGQLNGIGTANDVRVAGPYAYVTTGSAFLTVSIADPASPSILSSSPIAEGRSIELIGGYAYVVDQSGTKIFDLAVPAAPVLVNTLAGWADLAAVGPYLCRARPSQPLEVYGLADPVHPELRATFSGNPDGQFGDVVALGNRLVVSENHPFGLFCLHVLDFVEPSQLVLRGTLVSPAYLQTIAVTGEHLYASIQGPTTETNLGTAWVGPADYQAPIVPPSGYLPNIYGSAMDAQGSLVAVGAGWVTKIFSAANPMSPVLLGSYAHGAEVRGVKIEGEHAFVARNGLDILSLQDPSDPALTASLPLASGRAVDVADGYAYCAGTSLYVIDIADPGAPAVTGSLSFGTAVTEDIEVIPPYAYVLTGGSPTTRRLRVVDISDPSAPAEVGTGILEHAVRRLDVEGNLAYVGFSGEAPGHGKLGVFDLSDPGAPARRSTVDLRNFDIWDIQVHGAFAYIAGRGLMVADLRDPLVPAVVGQAALPGYTWLNGGSIAVADQGVCFIPGGSAGGLSIVGFGCPLSPAGGPQSVATAPALLQIWPNPTRGGSWIRWAHGPGVLAQVTVFDSFGRLVRAWPERGAGPGEAGLWWDGRTDLGRPATSGTYFVRIHSTVGQCGGKLTLVR